MSEKIQALVMIELKCGTVSENVSISNKEFHLIKVILANDFAELKLFGKETKVKVY